MFDRCGIMYHAHNNRPGLVLAYIHTVHTMCSAIYVVDGPLPLAAVTLPYSKAVLLLEFKSSLTPPLQIIVTHVMCHPFWKGQSIFFPSRCSDAEPRLLQRPITTLQPPSHCT